MITTLGTRAPGAPGELALESPIERIAVFRACPLGELLCAVPALRALRHGYPEAEITLIGLPQGRALSQRLPCIDRFIEFPGYPGLADLPCDVRALPDFLAQVQAQRFDLALQLHDGGLVANPLVASFGARHTAGFVAANAWRPEVDALWYAPWPGYGAEIERLLTLTDRLGLARRGSALEFPLREQDRAELAALWPGLGEHLRQGRPYVCVHAGAHLPSRRWPLERFAAVAERIAESGRTVVLTGDALEVARVDQVAALMRHEAVKLAGRTGLWTLGALIEGAEQVVCNDTSLSHIAAALRRPSVVISCGADVERWAPLDGERHVVLWQPMACRPCAHAVCPVGHGCAEAVAVEDVVRALQPALSRTLQDRALDFGSK